MNERNSKCKMVSSTIKAFRMITFVT
jgi:hypothetical protein